MKNSAFCVFLFLFLFGNSLILFAEGIPASAQQEINRALTRITAREIAGGWVKIERSEVSRTKVSIYASIGLSYYPFREQNVQAMYDSVRLLLPSEYAKAELKLYTDSRSIEELIPVALRRTVDRRKMKFFTNRATHPLVERQSAAWTPSGGLSNRHIAVWQSHGRYFDQRENRWRWQRSRLWETCEDLYTQSYVLPFLVPMLENAGANVLMPRERDVQKTELIADNDAGVDYATHYIEHKGHKTWKEGGIGFAHLQQIYRSGENPFTAGTVRKVETVVTGKESTATWLSDIPIEGEYAVYISYKTLNNSAQDAMYTVHHLGGESRFEVNQTMGGGTWIYLGRFHFSAGADAAKVVLSNHSAQKGCVVTADAVKIGGGFGNVARTVSPSLRKKNVAYTEEPSGYPRFCEGARYWLQWAGFDHAIYSPKEDLDDYRDDYMSRAQWVNALAGGSERLPDERGLNVPVDMALAFHSDAGVRDNDETIGTLGIFYTQENKGVFEGGADRYLSRDLTDLVITQVVGDIRRTFEPDWMRRGLWNRSYYEARVPGVPTMLLEVLSHQNFADMRYGLDPRFRFVVSRAVYKGILRHLSTQYDTPYVVQPLPVESFSCEFAGEDEVYLHWSATVDSLEQSAVPKGYVVYTRMDDGGFDNGRLVEESSCTLPIARDRQYSFKVTAVNDGGESFPSEILAVCRKSNEKGKVLVINGFNRVSAPLSLRNDSLAGFRGDLDGGVPYISDISYIGQQRIFDRAMARSENDRIALGSCCNDFETEVIGGNTFDYPALHGRALTEAGWSFCSTSVQAVEQGEVPFAEYDAIDLILGKQRSVIAGRGTRGIEFQTFTPALQTILRSFTQQGGALFVSGSYVATDLWTSDVATEADRQFAREVLHYSYAESGAAHTGRVQAITSPAGFLCGNYKFNTELTDACYAVESSDILRAEFQAFDVLRYAENNRAAGVAWMGAGAGRTVVLGFPFESLLDASRRNLLMRDVMNFLKPIK
ncbi:MAG: xanthan lyase [Alistipes sp.]